MGYRELAARERALAEAERARADRAREDWRYAAFQDTATEALARAKEHEAAAQRHLDAADEYERKAREAGEPGTQPESFP